MQSTMPSLSLSTSDTPCGQIAVRDVAVVVLVDVDALVLVVKVLVVVDVVKVVVVVVSHPLQVLSHSPGTVSHKECVSIV